MEQQGITLQAILTRHSTRAFLPKPIPKQLLQNLLETARFAPSGTNTQPWKVFVVQGTKKDQISDQVCKAHDALRDDPSLAKTVYTEPYPYYPETWVSPYIDRRRAVGWGMYGLLGIEKGQKEKMHAQEQRNFRFFDAPVGMFFTLDRIMGQGSLVDYGMFLQNIMVSAKAVGIDTCPQAAWNKFSSVILPLLGVDSEKEMLVCGMSLGYADPEATVNNFRTVREPIDSFTTWLD